MRWITIECSMTLSRMNVTTKTSVKSSMKTLNVWFARWIGSALGTDTI